MLSKEQKDTYRNDLFRHLDGIAIAPVAYHLYKNGVINELKNQPTFDISLLSKQFHANEGYLNIALRLLASQGWIDYTINNDQNKVIVSSNPSTEIAHSYFNLYKPAVEFLSQSRLFHPKSLDPDFHGLRTILTEFQNEPFKFSKDTKSKAIELQIQKHIEGCLMAPLTVVLAMNGFFHKYFMEASFRADEYHDDPENFEKILDFYTFLGWFTKKGHTYKFTDKGLFFARRASAYGVTVSYIPTFNRMHHLLFDEIEIKQPPSKNSIETHVDRVMNVWGSGGAHASYFRQIDEIIIEIFNQPLAEQPKGILDMGCGNGAFLIHLFEVIEQRTKRGKMLEEYPLFLVGADFNKEALKVTRANLVNADVWAKVIWGDIGDPQQLENDIFENYSIHLSELLNVRTFLDHNRSWIKPNSNTTIKTVSTGAYACKGKRLNTKDVLENLYEHLLKWKPHIKKHGLILIELHTLSPQLIANNLGKTAATAYDATHGFSDQYIVELEEFQNTLKRAKLKSDLKYFSKFPDSELATVSIQFIKSDSKRIT